MVTGRMREVGANQIRDVNVRYHDLAAAGYAAKWGISYEPAARAQVLAKLAKALGEPLRPVGRSLEIGAGTGYFTLHLVGAGLVTEAVASDISQGMLDQLERSAARLALCVETARCEAAQLPFPDSSFDLVFGHAVLHHLPEPEAAFAEFARVLRPGGRVAFCGEPSRYGDRLAAIPKRAGLALAPAWRRALGAGARRNGDEPTERELLEPFVDVHSFTAAELRGLAQRAGLECVRVTGEELAASWFGWLNRSLESTVEPAAVPRAWLRFAYRGYLTLQALDRAVFEPRLRPGAFYTLLLSARAPA